MPDATDRRIVEVRHFEHPSGVDQCDIRYADGTVHTATNLPWAEARELAQRVPRHPTVPSPPPRPQRALHRASVGVVAVTIVAVLLAACVPPPPPPPDTPYAEGGGQLIATWNGTPFCVFTGHVDINLTSDTTYLARTWAEVTEITPGLAPCNYNLFAVSAWMTCSPPDCGNQQLPMPHLEQVVTEQFTSRSMDFRRLQFHIFGHYQGSANTSYDAQASPLIRCNPDGTACVFKVGQ